MADNFSKILITTTYKLPTDLLESLEDIPNKNLQYPTLLSMKTLSVN